jgi:heme/copper-type cytochrome/quinol oxidase subunit 1
MRSELMCVNEQLLFGDTQFYNVLITSHAMLMIFWFVMPILLGGFGNLYLPSMLGAGDGVPTVEQRLHRIATPSRTVPDRVLHSR